jgi:hypothetical protein
VSRQDVLMSTAFSVAFYVFNVRQRREGEEGNLKLVWKITCTRESCKLECSNFLQPVQDRRTPVLHSADLEIESHDQGIFRVVYNVRTDKAYFLTSSLLTVRMELRPS